MAMGFIGLFSLSAFREELPASGRRSLLAGEPSWNKERCNESPGCRYIIMMRSKPTPPDEVLPDAGLIERARQGEEAACSELVARHLAPVRAFVAMRLPIGHVVDEITHETFVFAFTHLAEFELRESFRAWLRSIAFNLVRRELLRFARERQNLSNFERLQLSELADNADQTGLRDEVVFLEECMGRLPDTMRQLLEDRYHRGLTGVQIAASRGRTEEWVRVTLLRIRRQLRDCIDHKMTGGAHAV